ncbi:MAG: DUF5995 family protein [Anaerolineae bacterium]
MTSIDRTVLLQMNERVQHWEDAHDRRSIFLGCYALMTGNMLDALDAGRFIDDEWVARLLRRFAQYYFDALALYEARSSTTPRVWQLAHGTAQHARFMTVQQLLIGVNAHINYDLVFATAELLQPEWAALSTDQREQRRRDYELVNSIIGQTIDSVQDQILEPQSPWLDVVDRLMGPVDEWLISELIEHWRDEVWRQAVQYLDTSTAEEREALRVHIEKSALRRGHDILGEILLP